MLKGNGLANEAAGSVFVLFWEIIALLVEKVLLYF